MPPQIKQAKLETLDMKEEKTTELPCSHFFEYSLKEQELITYGGTNFREVDVVICRKCGLTQRN